MKKLRKNKKFVLGASVALTAMMLAAATFAWYSAKDKVDNEFKSGGIPDGSVKVVEIFDKDKAQEALPGTKVQKDVLVANYGKVPVFVRATFDEKITKLLADGDAPKKLLSDTKVTADATKIPVPSVNYAGNTDFKTPTEAGVTITGLPADVVAYVKADTVTGTGTTPGTAYTFVFVTDDNNIVDVEYTFDEATKAMQVTSTKYAYYEYDAQKTANWPTTATGGTTIDKGHFVTDSLINLNYHDNNFAATPTADKWFFNASDGWFYYIAKVDGGKQTPYMLNNVQIDGAANNTYQYMQYTLTVNAEAIQASAEALASWNLAETDPIYVALKPLAAE